MGNIGLEEINCSICGSSGKLPVLTTKLGFSLARCVQCSFQFYSPRPPSEHIEEYYFGEDFYRKVNVKSVESVLPLLPEIPGTLLDVGCGVGALVSLANKIGWNAVGVDTSPKAVELAKKELNLDILSDRLENCSFKPESFDVIVLLAVLEHVFEPLTMMKQVKSLLKPGGTVIFSTPNLDNLPYLMIKNKADYSWFIKEHINHFTLKTHRTLLKKAGLHNVTFHHCGHFIVEGTENGTNLLFGEEFLIGVRESLPAVIEGLSKEVYSKMETHLSDADLMELMCQQIKELNILPGEYSLTHAVYGRVLKTDGKKP